MKPLILIGGGGHCKACIDVIESEGRFQIIGILDPKLISKGVKNICGYPILGDDEQLPLLKKEISHAFISIGQIKTASIRRTLYFRLKDLGFILPSIISPLAYVSKHSCIQEGSIVMHHALINACVSIGKMCIINSKSLIEHDCIIEDFCHLSTGSIINGHSHIQKESFIASNVSLKHQSNIQEKSIIFSLTSKITNGGGVSTNSLLPKGEQYA